MKALNESCNGRCLNDYRFSDEDNPDIYTASFFCSEPQEQCIKVTDLCRGVSWCEDDVKICNKQLKCPGYYGFVGLDKHPPLYSMNDHTYCYYNATVNDGHYDNIDRSDESFKLQIGNVEQSKIKYETMTQCYDDFGNWIGLRCGDKCLQFYRWCINADVNYGRHSCGTFNSDDTLLCQNTSFWESVPCVAYDDAGGGLVANGTRCSGKSQHCLFPWYSHKDPELALYLKSILTCTDKSDEIFFDNGTICSDITYNYISKHNENWCNIVGQALTIFLQEITNRTFCRDLCYDAPPMDD